MKLKWNVAVEILKQITIVPSKLCIKTLFLGLALIKNNKSETAEKWLGFLPV
jgi:hypothetical protein